MHGYPWTDRADLIVAGAKMMAGASLKDCLHAWRALPPAEQAGAHVAMTWNGIAIPGEPDGPRYQILHAPELVRLAKTLAEGD